MYFSFLHVLFVLRPAQYVLFVLKPALVVRISIHVFKFKAKHYPFNKKDRSRHMIFVSVQPFSTTLFGVPFPRALPHLKGSGNRISGPCEIRMLRKATPRTWRPLRQTYQGRSAGVTARLQGQAAPHMICHSVLTSFATPIQKISTAKYPAPKSVAKIWAALGQRGNSKLQGRYVPTSFNYFE